MFERVSDDEDEVAERGFSAVVVDVGVGCGGGDKDSLVIEDLRL